MRERERERERIGDSSLLTEFKKNIFNGLSKINFDIIFIKNIKSC